MPEITVANYSTLGNNSFRKLTRYSHTAQLAVSKQTSRHTIRFGGNFDISQINNLDEISGNFNFGRALTSCDPSVGGPCTAQLTGSEVSGHGIASMLLGTGGGGVQIRPDKAMTLHAFGAYIGAYIQDTWRVTRKFTLNAGLRYENQRPATERFNRLSYFNPHVVSPLSDQVALGRPILGGFEFASAENRHAWPADNKNFAPRIGLAYQITDKLVARAGFGIFFLPTSAMLSYDDPGQFLGFSADTPWLGTVDGLGFIPDTRASNIFPGGVNRPTGGSQGLLTYAGLGVGQAASASSHWL